MRGSQTSIMVETLTGRNSNKAPVAGFVVLGLGHGEYCSHVRQAKSNKIAQPFRLGFGLHFDFAVQCVFSRAKYAR